MKTVTARTDPRAGGCYRRAMSPLFAALVLATQLETPDRVIVLDLDAGDGVSADEVRTLSGTIAEVIAADPSVMVVTSGDLRTLSSIAAEKMACGADDGSCLSELAGAMDVRRVVSGRVAGIGDSLVVQLVLFDAKSGASKRASWQAANLEELVARAPAQTRALMLGQAPPPERETHGPSPLWGGITLGAGAVVGGLATAAGVVLNATVSDAGARGADKDVALDVGRWGVVGGGVLALGLGVTGAVLLAVSE